MDAPASPPRPSIRLTGETEAHRGFTRLVVQEMEVTGPSGRVQTWRREVEDHGPAVAVLPYDPERGVAVLVRQLRPAVAVAGGDPFFLEVPAGLQEPGEPADQTARREAEEEAGVTLAGLEYVGSAWSMPGLSTERIALFLGLYAGPPRLAHAGLATEGEDIEVAEWPLPKLAAMALGGELLDMKTLALVQALMIRRPHLFEE